MSGTDGVKFADGLLVRLNPEPEPDQPARDQLPPLPPRPSEDDGAEEWLDYVVALGGDREVFDQFDAAELMELADRFGG